MIVPQSALDAILNGRIRQRIIQIPVRHGKFGERKRCPVHRGRSYKLRAHPPYAQYKARAERQPTRARAVLTLIDVCQQPTRTATITVLAVQRQDTTWVVRFNLGDQSTAFDRPVFLAKYGDYTMTPSKQAIPGDPEVMMPLAEDLARARAKARERRVSPQRELVNKMQADADTLRASLATMKARNRLRRIEHDLKTLALELPSAGVLDSPSTIAGDRPHMDVASHERPPVSRNARDSRDADADASRGVEAA